ncbi:LacI family DNA-binding transcriptional regulator [Leifsonia sp. F6_8S_P_1B]|uniref:LacI family DNA-binding transcriptional regulator n=1 Tax=Leifsonia williamsii TaxID=3035919 RepID=A0ABT8KB73_9MICO|nr:LacI family DNA-binding transcriptional regulator [Leifsonia williamsii]MDN4614071.1 LacI family DNA-binding transcriptional regulator [Leifsonia williamsii]
MPGISDVARLAGVSTATVSRALSGNGAVSAETRVRVTQAAASLGYVVSSDASSLASGRTRNVGVVVSHLSRWYFTAVIEGAQRVLLQRGYDVTLYNLGGEGEERPRVFEHHLLRGRVDAVIAVALKLTEDEIGRLLAIGKPVAGVGGPLPGASTVTIDDVHVGRLATEHLLALGHRRIAHLGGRPEFDLEFHVPTSRRLGYEAALLAAGIAPDPALSVAGDFTIPGGHEAARRLLEPALLESAQRRPTAVFAASDEMAIGAVLAARELGLSVPGDLSVIGVDDHPLAAFFGLSTVAQHVERQGEQVAELLLRTIDPPRRHGPAADDAPTTLHSPVDLVVRTSTAAPADHPTPTTRNA